MLSHLGPIHGKSADKWYVEIFFSQVMDHPRTPFFSLNGLEQWIADHTDRESTLPAYDRLAVGTPPALRWTTPHPNTSLRQGAAAEVVLTYISNGCGLVI